MPIKTRKIPDSILNPYFCRLTKPQSSYEAESGAYSSASDMSQTVFEGMVKLRPELFDKCVFLHCLWSLIYSKLEIPEAVSVPLKFSGLHNPLDVSLLKYYLENPSLFQHWLKKFKLDVLMDFLCQN